MEFDPDAYLAETVDNRDLVFASLKNSGASDVATAAIMGDIEQESNFNPRASGDRGTSRGLLQTGVPMFRQYENEAARKGIKPGSPDYVYGQVPFVIDKFKQQHPDRWEAMQNAPDAATALQIFRSTKDWGYGIAGSRYQHATDYERLIKGDLVLNPVEIEKAKPVEVRDVEVRRAQLADSGGFNPDVYLSEQPESQPEPKLDISSFNPDEYLGIKPEPKSATSPMNMAISQLAQDHPFFQGVAEGVIKLVPKSIGELGEFAKGMTMPFLGVPKAVKQAYDAVTGKPIGEVYPESLPLARLEAIKKQYGGGSPEYQKAAGEAAGNYITQILMAAGIAKGLTPDVAGIEAVKGIKAATEEAVAKPVKPVESPEAPPAPEPRAFTEPTVARVQPPQTADITRSILDRRNELLAEAQQLGEQAQISQKMGQRVHPAIEARLAEINQEINQPAIGSLERSFPGAVEAPESVLQQAAGQPIVAPSEQTGRVAVSPVSTTPGDIAVGQQPIGQERPVSVGARPGAIETGAIERFDPDQYLNEAVDPRTGISNKAFQAIYGKGEIPSATGRGPAAWKQFGDERLARGDDPYAAITRARQTGIMEPEDLALVRSEHKRLVGDARAAEGTPAWAEKSRFAADVADAIQQTAKGPASDVLRGLQEWDEPTFDNLTDFDQIVRKRQGTEMDASQVQTFQKIADDVRNTSNAARTEADTAINRTRNYRPKEKMSFEEATKNLHDQITELTKNCIL